MPTRPASRCPICKHLHTGTGRCTSCTTRIRGSRQARGYGPQHQRDRAAALAQANPATPCARCRHPLGVDYRTTAHLDHTEDRSGYLGLSHGAPCPTCRISCNLSAGGRAAHQ